MVKDKKFLSYKKIHIVGIGGISMNALAKYCLANKKQVSGSDTAMSAQTEQLKRKGVKIYLGHHSSAVIGKDLVVYTSAVNQNNVELTYSKSQNIPTVKRSEFLGEILAKYKNSIAISGCHGKTTTTAMLGCILIEAGLDPTIFLGGEYGEYGNFRKGKNKYVIAEACEYKKNFLFMPHNVSVVLNVDYDHLDSFTGMQDLVDSFNKFIGQSLSIVNGDDKNCSNVFNKTTVTFGLEKACSFMAKNLKKCKKGYSFDFLSYGFRVGKIRLSVMGRYNVYNALAAAATATCLGVDFLYVKRGLEKFSGVKRRSECLGEKFGIKFIADYAHHPKEILETANALKVFNQNDVVIFQPHTYSRTKNLFDEFLDVLKNSKNLIIYKTYPAREQFDYEGSAIKLYEKLKEQNVNVFYCDTPLSLNQILVDNFINKERAVFFGAGDIYNIALKIVKGEKL